MIGVKTRFALLLSVVMGAAVMNGAAVAPCTNGSTGGGPGSEVIIPVRSSSMTYCVSDYGWSDTWFRSGTITQYNQVLDVLSGDDAPNFRWSGGTNGSGTAMPSDHTGWLGPSLDADGTAPQSVGASIWARAQNVAYVTPGDLSRARSVLTRTGWELTITTSVTGLRADIRIDIRNTTSNRTFTDVLIGDYFRFHPNGSTGSETGSGSANATRNQGIVYYLPGSDPRCSGGGGGTTSNCIFTEGNMAHTLSGNPTFIGNGRMWGSLVTGSNLVPMNPTSWMIGSASNFNGVPDNQRIWELVEANSYNNPALGSSYGRGDVAGAFQWNLGSIAPGQTVSFVITKEITDIPEPGTLALMLFGAGLIWYRRRARA